MAPTIMKPRGVVAFEVDQMLMKRLLKKVASMKKNQNRVMVPAMRAGMALYTRDIRKRIPDYRPKRPSRSVHRTPTGRRRGRLWEAKKAIGTSAKAQTKGKGGTGNVYGKAGSNVGKPVMTSYDRAVYRSGLKGRGIGRGNLHWYLLGTKKRYTRTGIYTGQMRRVNIVWRAKIATDAAAERAMRARIKKGLKKLYRISK